jgi:hypothetical protein
VKERIGPRLLFLLNDERMMKPEKKKKGESAM